MAVRNRDLPIIHNPAIPRIKRTDAWWLSPLLIFVGLASFIIYTTWRVFENNYYDTYNIYPYFHLVSPFYSPVFFRGLHVFGVGISPALWILPFPLLFRGTCYYFRKAYYRAFFWHPVACAVDEGNPHRDYTGERNFPLVLQNLHRYAFYCAAIIVLYLWWDAFDAFRYSDPTPGSPVHFGVSVGSLLFLLDVIFLSLYTFGCHAWRHLSGGCLNCYSCSGANRARQSLWQKVTRLNENHELWAWLSLLTVALSDLYVRLVNVHIITNSRLF